MIIPFGDEALLVVLGEVIDPEVNEQAHALARRVEEAARVGNAPWGMPVVGYASVLVPYDGLALDADEAIARLTPLASAADTGNDAREAMAVRAPIEVGVRYGGADGPDLQDVADRTGLTPAQVVEAHASTVYRVYLLGFVPGFPYLGVLPAELVLPRRAEPRLRVSAGSVAIAGRQTAIYPSESPSGWHVLGSTDAVMWDLAREAPALLAPGMTVRFIPLARQ